MLPNYNRSLILIDISKRDRRVKDAIKFDAVLTDVEFAQLLFSTTALIKECYGNHKMLLESLYLVVKLVLELLPNTVLFRESQHTGHVYGSIKSHATRNLLRPHVFDILGLSLYNF